jgi:hypothetical protein
MSLAQDVVIEALKDDRAAFAHSARSGSRLNRPPGARQAAMISTASTRHQ